MVMSHTYSRSELVNAVATAAMTYSFPVTKSRTVKQSIADMIFTHVCYFWFCLINAVVYHPAFLRETP